MAVCDERPAVGLAAVEGACRHHPFPARFPVELADGLIGELGGRSGVVVDPFMGSGTTAVAAALQRREVRGGDVDAVAGLLTRVKLAARPSEGDGAWRERLGRRLGRLATEVPDVVLKPGDLLEVGGVSVRLPNFKELAYWFPADGGLMLGVIAGVLATVRDRRRRELGWAALTACVLAKWPATCSYAMDVDHARPHRVEQAVPPSRVVATFFKRLDRQLKAADVLHRAYADAGALGHAEAALTGVRWPADARQTWDVEPGSAALVVTSPPYGPAVDYPRASRLAACWVQPWAWRDVPDPDRWLKTRKVHVGLRHASLDPAAWYADHKPIRRLVAAVSREHTKHGARMCGFFDDLAAVLGQTERALRPGGQAAFVIADNVVGGERVPVARVVKWLAHEVGLAHVATRRRRIATLRRRYPVGPFGFDGPMTHESVVVFRRDA